MNGSNLPSVRLPAEWEPHDAVWIVPPHNRETWPGCFEAACKQFETFAKHLKRFTSVCTTSELAIATNDSWIRDFGPIFVWQDEPESWFIHDFRFNAWGGKYEPRSLDDAAAAQIAEHLGIPRRRHEFVLEGGSIEVNGRGTLITTESCLLNPNRNLGLTRGQIECELRRTLGLSHIIWLPEGIQGDDTDGHIDNLARFIGPSTVAAVSAGPDHPDHETTQRNLAQLRRSTDEHGQSLKLVELPAPPVIHHDYPADRFGPGGPAPLPASYANFLISNHALFLPTFGVLTDDKAVNILTHALPEHTIIPLRAEYLTVGRGAFHCLTMAQPRLE